MLGPRMGRVQKYFFLNHKTHVQYLICELVISYLPRLLRCLCIIPRQIVKTAFSEFPQNSHTREIVKENHPLSAYHLCTQSQRPELSARFVILCTQSTPTFTIHQHIRGAMCLCHFKSRGKC